MSDLRKALETIGNTLTQVFDLPIKKLCKKEYRLLERAIEEIEKGKKK